MSPQHTRRPGKLTKSVADSLAYVAVVVDHVDDGRAARFGSVPNRKMRLGTCLWEEPLDDLRQFIELHRFVQMNAVLERYIAQGPCRYVAGQNNDWDLAMNVFPQLRGDLEPVHTVR